LRQASRSALLIVAAEYTSRGGVLGAFVLVAFVLVVLVLPGCDSVGSVVAEFMYWAMKSSIDSALVRSTSGKPVRKGALGRVKLVDNLEPCTYDVQFYARIN
jgi:hypothetical protein